MWPSKLKTILMLMLMLAMLVDVPYTAIGAFVDYMREGCILFVQRSEAVVRCAAPAGDAYYGVLTTTTFILRTLGVIVQLQRYQIKGRDAHGWIQRAIFLGRFDQNPIVEHASVVDTTQCGTTGSWARVVTATTTDISDQPLVLIDTCCNGLIGTGGTTKEQSNVISYQAA
jgi:hypothetical protein